MGIVISFTRNTNDIFYYNKFGSVVIFVNLNNYE